MKKSILITALVAAVMLSACGTQSESGATATPTEAINVTEANELVPIATSTPAPTATNTPEPTATSTPVPTVTNTPVPTATSTPVPTATNTPVPTATNTPTPTATSTPTPTEVPEKSEVDKLGLTGVYCADNTEFLGGRFYFLVITEDNLVYYWEEVDRYGTWGEKGAVPVAVEGKIVSMEKSDFHWGTADDSANVYYLIQSKTNDSYKYIRDFYTDGNMCLMDVQPIDTIKFKRVDSIASVHYYFSGFGKEPEEVYLQVPANINIPEEWK